MHVDYLIIGQGICGTMLSWFLHREGKSFVVMDDGNENSSSKIAAGIINPVTGRRYVSTWMIEDLMPFALQVYEDLGLYLGTKLVSGKSIIDFFPSPQMRNAFIDRIGENDTYLHSYPDQNHFNQYFHYDFGCGEIRPAFSVHLSRLLSLWRKRLMELNALHQASFTADELQILDEGIGYGSFTAEKIIFCDGVDGTSNPFFQRLPFAPNKGEALIIECRELNSEHIFKKGIMLTPLPETDTFWVGSNYQWEFSNNEPSEQFYRRTVSQLDSWLKLPYKVLHHRAALRPATLERRPFVGFHPRYPAVGILNGMGTKGTSLAPYFANQLTQHLVHGFPIAPEADIFRFNRILNR